MEIMTWSLMWLNRSVATLNATLQLLDIYKFVKNDCFISNKNLLFYHDLDSKRKKKKK